MNKYENEKRLILSTHFYFILEVWHYFFPCVFVYTIKHLSCESIQLFVIQRSYLYYRCKNCIVIFIYFYQ
jgi:hypothetical protein